MAKKDNKNIKMQCEGDEEGKGKGHIRYIRKSKAKAPLRLKMYCSITSSHLWYKETK